MRDEEVVELVDKFGRDIYGFCRRLARTRENTEDLYQQTFMRALELCEKIDMNNNPKGYLISIAVRQWQNYIRKERRRQSIVPIDYYSSESDMESVSDGMLVEDEVEGRIVRGQILQLIDSLPEKLRIPMIMFYNADMAFKDIAKALKIPEGTVKSRIHKARKIIREGLEVKGYGKI